MNETWFDLLRAVGPTAAIAIFALWSNHKFIMGWMERFDKLVERLDRLERNNRAVAEALSEVTEALRRLNGKE